VHTVHGARAVLCYRSLLQSVSQIHCCGSLKCKFAPRGHFAVYFDKVMYMMTVCHLLHSLDRDPATGLPASKGTLQWVETASRACPALYAGVG
jgi:hypothetical protein